MPCWLRSPFVLQLSEHAAAGEQRSDSDRSGHERARVLGAPPFVGAHVALANPQLKESAQEN